MVTAAPAPEARADAGLAGPAIQPGSARLHHLDYLGAGLVALVLVHHTAITYGAAASWYYFV